jgi:cytochrome P450
VTRLPSYTKTLLEKRPFFKDEHEASYMVGMMVNVTIKAIGSQLRTFVLAVTLYPDWQAAVYNEIHSVVGDVRMVQLPDSPRLPTLREVIKECFRWRPPIPTGELSSVWFPSMRK